MRNNGKEIKIEDLTNCIPQSLKNEKIVPKIKEENQVLRNAVHLTTDKLKNENLKNGVGIKRLRLLKVVGSLPRKCKAPTLPQKSTKVEKNCKIIKNICCDLLDIVLELKKINRRRKLPARENAPRGFEKYQDDKVQDIFTYM